MVYAIHENQQAKVRLDPDCAYQLSTGGGKPGQGYPAVLITGEENMIHDNTVALEGNGARPSHKGDGWRERDTMYTLNTTEVHAVAYREEYDRDNSLQHCFVSFEFNEEQ